MKRNTKIFWRAFFISFTIVLSLVIVIIGMFESYKNMQKINVYNSKTATKTVAVILVQCKSNVFGIIFH